MRGVLIECTLAVKVFEENVINITNLHNFMTATNIWMFYIGMMPQKWYLIIFCMNYRISDKLINITCTYY